MIAHALKELVRKWRWTLVFVFNLSFGFIGFISLLSFQNSIENKILLDSKKILTADLSISARKKIATTEIDKTKKIIRDLGIKIESESYLTEFMAMLKTSEKAQMVSVKAIDANYPLYGDLELLWENKNYSDIKSSFKNNETIVYSELKEILNLQKEQSLMLGKLNLSLRDIVVKDSTQNFKFGGIAPKIFIHQEALKNSELLKFGSTFNESYLFKLKEPYPRETLLKKLEQSIPDATIKIETAESAANDSARQLGFLTDFLKLIAIISILLSSLGANFLYQVFIFKKIKDYAIFKALGLNKQKLRAQYLVQMITLSLVVTAISALGSYLFIPLIQFFLNKTLSIIFEISIPNLVIVLSFFIIFITCFLVTIPFLFSLETITTAKLFNEEKLNLNISIRSRVPQILSVFLVGLLSLYLTKSVNLTLIFISSVLSIAIFSVVIGWSGIKVLSLFNPRFWVIKYSLKSIIRKKGTSIIVFSCIAISTMLMNILPLVRTSLQEEFNYNKNEQIPSLFLIDVQEEQVNAINELLQLQNLKIDNLSPLIRARISKINDIPFEKKLLKNSFTTREEETEARFRNRGINLTYRHEFSNTETLLEGIPFTNYKDETPGLSLEYKYAERIGVKLNDLMTFDIQGVEIKGKVINLRKVRWISFQPNFFIAFDEGVLNQAPKSFIGTINNLSEEKTKKVISSLAENFSNISIIDVRALSKDILNMADQMSLSIQIMALLALITGLIILSSIIYIQLNERTWELNFLKIIGAKFNSVYLYILVEFAFLTFLAALFGSLLSYVFSFILVKYLFETTFVISFKEPLFIIFGIALISIVICLIITRRILQNSANKILKEF